jgi:glycosyltransferase involved in cell wall biosynthesis
MELVLVNTRRGWGGGEKWHFEVATALHRRGRPVGVLAAPGSALAGKLRREAPALPLATEAIGNLSFLDPLRMRRLARWFRRQRVRTVVLNLPSDLKAAGMAARWAGVGRIVYRRGTALPVRNSPFNRHLFRHVATEVLANSRQTAETLLARNPALFPRERIRVIYNGLQLDAWHHLPAPAPIPEDAPQRTLWLGNLGRMVEQKGQRLLLPLLARLRAEGYPVGLLLGGDGPLREALAGEAEQRGLAPWVEMPGFVEDVPAFMRRLDVFVLPSLWEGFGYVLAEAMYFRRPVVAFRHSSNPEIVAEGETGLLVRPGSGEALYEGVRALLDDPPARVRMGRAGRARVERCFDFERIIAQLEAYFF